MPPLLKPTGSYNGSTNKTVLMEHLNTLNKKLILWSCSALVRHILYVPKTTSRLMVFLQYLISIVRSVYFLTPLFIRHFFHHYASFSMYSDQTRTKRSK